MTCAVVGTITGSRRGTLFVKDALTSEVHELLPANDETMELPVGTSGIFIGEMANGQAKIRHFVLQRLLDPMYEEDILGVAGEMILDLVDDPFPEIYRLKEQEEQALRAQEEAEKLSRASKED